MTQRHLIGSAIASLVLVPAAAGEITEEQVDELGRKAQDLGVPREQIEEITEKLYEFRRAGQTPATAQHYLERGPSAEHELTRAVAIGVDGLELARAVLLRTETPRSAWPDYAALNGLARHTSQAVVDLLGEAAALHGPLDPLWQASRDAWSGAFRRLHGDSGFELAQQRVADQNLTPEQRGLHLLVSRRRHAVVNDESE